MRSKILSKKLNTMKIKRSNNKKTKKVNKKSIIIHKLLLMFSFYFLLLLLFPVFPFYSMNPESFRFCLIIISLHVSKTLRTLLVSVAHVI